jgi:hypothetical protein
LYILPSTSYFRPKTTPRISALTSESPSSSEKQVRTLFCAPGIGWSTLHYEVLKTFDVGQHLGVLHRLISRLDVAHTCESARITSPTRRQICGGSISRLFAVWKGRNNQFPFQVVPAPPSSAPPSQRALRPAAPGSRDFQPYGTWTLKPYSSAQSTTSCSSYVGRHSRAHRGPLISLPYCRDHLPVATCSVAHAASSAPASVLPLPCTSPRALCVARRDTFLTDHRTCQTVTDIRFAD